MASHWVLACYGPPGVDRTLVGNIKNSRINWQTGRRLSEPMPQTLEVTLDPNFPGVMMSMYDAGILLMTRKLLNAIVSAGVDNLQTIEAVVEDATTSVRFTEYVAVNIVGAVSAADLKRSTYSAPSGSALVDVDFDSLALKSEVAAGYKLFRLAECITAIIIADSVKQSITAAGISDLQFVDPLAWIG